MEDLVKLKEKEFADGLGQILSLLTIVNNILVLKFGEKRVYPDIDRKYLGVGFSNKPRYKSFGIKMDDSHNLRLYITEFLFKKLKNTKGFCLDQDYGEYYLSRDLSDVFKQATISEQSALLKEYIDHMYSVLEKRKK
ncbi:hypothetical protein ACFLVE_04075 [Chloroflexota bacterium]